jgi:hypothetical protein
MIAEYENRTEYRNEQGKLHRENGPAVLYKNGTVFYYKNGLIHREDGPAIMFADGERHYYINGSIHNENGPAIIFANGKKEYRIYVGTDSRGYDFHAVYNSENTIKYSVKAGCRNFTDLQALRHWKDNPECLKLARKAIAEFEEIEALIKDENSVAEPLLLNRGVKMNKTDRGIIEYRNQQGELHREDGPALIFPDGEVQYYIEGALEREDGPAIIRANGEKVYSICVGSWYCYTFLATYSESYPGEEKYRVSVDGRNLTKEQALAEYGNDPDYSFFVKEAILKFPVLKALVEKDLLQKKRSPTDAKQDK